MAKKQEENVVPSGIVPSGKSEMTAAPSFIEDSKDGFERMSAQDMAWPRAFLIQKSSKIFQDRARSKGLQFGDVINDLTDEKLCSPESEIDVIPVFHFKSWIEWASQEDGGGVVRASLDEKSDVAIDAVNGRKNKDDRALVTEYQNFLCILPDRIDHEGKPQIVLVSMKGTSHKTGKKLLMLARMRGKALYAGRYRLSTKLASKGDMGWAEWTVENATTMWVTDEAMYAFAKQLHAEAKENANKMDAMLLAAREQNEGGAVEPGTPPTETKW